MQQPIQEDPDTGQMITRIMAPLSYNILMGWNHKRNLCTNYVSACMWFVQLCCHCSLLHFFPTHFNPILKLKSACKSHTNSELSTSDLGVNVCMLSTLWMTKTGLLFGLWCTWGEIRKAGIWKSSGSGLADLQPLHSCLTCVSSPPHWVDSLSRFSTD
jgi:hypothetical protein